MVQTNSVSHDFAVIHYGWKDFFPISDDQKSRKVINMGITYLSFSRTKKLGNVLNITYAGFFPDLYIGDWIVLRTTSRGKLDTSEEDTGSPNSYLDSGLVRFIGQVHSITSQYNTDADDILRKSYNVLVREWSHILNIPIRYSDETRVLGATSATQFETLKSNYLKNSSSNFIQKETDAANWKKFLETRYPAFQIIKNITTMMGIRSAVSDKTDILNKIPLTTSDLPKIPSAIYYDHILEYEEEKYEDDYPFNTGFLFELIGTQKWDSINFTNNLFLPEDSTNIVDANGKRPPVFINTKMYAQGFIFSDIVRQILDTGGEYEIFSDLLYFDHSGGIVCKPVLVVRDKPLSFKSLANNREIKQYTKSEGDFGFTYKDDIPRITLPLTNVLSFSISYSMEDAYNFIQFKPAPKSIVEHALTSTALVYGRYKDSFSQKRFGGKEYSASTAEFLTSFVEANPSPSPKPTKVTESKKKTKPPSEKDTADKVMRSSDVNKIWFLALVEKYKYYLPAKIAMPNCTVQIIDNNFPLSVGLMVRIPLGEGRPTICGEIEEISSTYKISGDGKISNQTYIKLSDLLMENPEDPKILNIIPKEISRTLFIDINKENTEQKNFILPR